MHHKNSFFVALFAGCGLICPAVLPETVIPSSTIFIAPDKDIYLTEGEAALEQQSPPVTFELVTEQHPTMKATVSDDWQKELNMLESIKRGADVESWNPRRFLSSEGWKTMHFQRMKMFMGVNHGSYFVRCYLQGHAKPFYTKKIIVSKPHQAVIIQLPDYYAVVLRPEKFDLAMRDVVEPKTKVFMCEFLDENGKPNGDRVIDGDFSWRKPEMLVYTTMPTKFKLWVGIDDLGQAGISPSRGIAWKITHLLSANMYSRFSEFLVQAPEKFGVQDWPAMNR
jgi:hypothetical protein